MKISDLKSLPHNTPVLAIEGQIKSVRSSERKANPSSGQQEWQQSILISQGLDEAWVNMKDEKFSMGQDVKGRVVLFECKLGGSHGPTGVKVRVPQNGGKPSITITGTAILKWPSGSPAPQSQQQPSPAARQASPSPTSPSLRNGAQVGNAINNSVLLITNGLIDAGEDPLATVESTALKILAMADRLEKGEVKTSMGWKSFIHPTQNKPLGELDEASKTRLIKWAFSNPSPKESDRIIHGNALLMAAELKMTPWGLLESAGASEEGFTSMIQRDYQVQFPSDLTPNQWGMIFRNFDAIVKSSNETNQPY